MFTRISAVLFVPALMLAVPQVALAKAQPKTIPKAATPTSSESKYDEAGAHYQRGVEQFSLGNYEDAIVEFKLAYAAGGPPGLLFNIAQAQRAAGHAQEALAYYKEYLRLVPEAPNRSEVETRMADIEVELQAASEAARGILPTPPATQVADRGMSVELPVQTIALRPGSMLEPTVAPYHPGTRLKWGGVAVMSSGALAVGFGMYFAAMSGDASDTLDQRASNGVAWTVSEQRLYERGQRDETLAASLTAVGAAALLTGAIMTYIGWQQDEQAAEFAFVPTPGGARAVMAWGF
jgi:tetratricopeptide (TPR) repeat protein